MTIRRIAYLGNIWEYPQAIARIPGAALTAILYEGPEDTQGALRAGKASGARVFRVQSDADVRLALEAAAPIGIGIMANFGILLSESTLAQPERGIVNFHPGLLPEQAGREPVARLWRAGGGPSGLTVHLATPKVDAGPVLVTYAGRVQAEYPLDANILSLYRLGLEALPSVIFPPQKAIS